MNKARLVGQLAESIGTTNAEAGRMLAAFTDIVSSVLAKGESVTLVGFGVFETKKRSARHGRNPITGKSVQIPAKRLPRFRPGSKLLEAVAE